MQMRALMWCPPPTSQILCRPAPPPWWALTCSLASPQSRASTRGASTPPSRRSTSPCREELGEAFDALEKNRVGHVRERRVGLEGLNRSLRGALERAHVHPFSG